MQYKSCINFVKVYPSHYFRGCVKTPTTISGGSLFLIIIAAINAQDDYQKTRNYWKYLKTKLSRGNKELVSITHQFKLQAPDGKQRLTDMLDGEGIILLAKAIPNSKAMSFLDWFTYSDNTIDGQSRKKAYQLLRVTF